MPIHDFALGGLTVRTWFLLGQLPFVLTMALLLFAVRRAGATWRAACLSSAAFVAGMALGTALLPSVLGAIAGGLGLWVLAQWILGVRRPPLAVAGLCIAGTVAVGRWGCLLNGCCFGKATLLPWGIHYDDTSAAFILHQALDWVAPDATLSLAVHPYPAYESLGLLLWMPIGIWLLRRLRSQGAVLAFTAAYDLGLRAFIDGTRAMVNVWWALLGSWLGLDLLQWALLVSAGALVVVGLMLERRATLRPVVESEPARSASVEAAWAVYLGICVIALLTNGHQTRFLHGVVLLALALAALALPLPEWLPLPVRGRRGLGFALAGALLIAVGVHGGRLVQAESSGADHTRGSAVTTSKSKREWMYDVDTRRGLLVRVADNATDASVRRERELKLGLPTEPSSSEGPDLGTGDLAARSRARKPLLWVGGGMSRGYGRLETDLHTKSNSDSCSNDYRIDHRRTVAGFALAEYQTPYLEVGTLSYGAGLGYGHETFSTEFSPTTAGTAGTYERGMYIGQVWAEWAHPNFALGLGLLGDLERFKPTSGLTHDTSTAFQIQPALHLRGGFSFLGVDMAYLDPSFSSPLGSSRYGLYAAISREGGRIHSIEQTLVRVFVGAVEFPGFPGSDHRLRNLSFGGGVEVFILPTCSLNGTLAGVEHTLFGSLQLRAAYSPW